MESMALALAVASMAAWDIGRRWVAGSKDAEAAEQRLQAMHDELRASIDHHAKQTKANLDSIEALTVVIKRMQSDHGAMTAMGQTALQQRRGGR